MHEFIYKNKPPPLSHRPQAMENDIHSIIPDIYIAPLKSTTTQRRYRPQQLTLCRSLHAEALQATVSEGLAQRPWRGG